MLISVFALPHDNPIWRGFIFINTSYECWTASLHRVGLPHIDDILAWSLLLLVGTRAAEDLSGSTLRSAKGVIRASHLDQVSPRTHGSSVIRVPSPSRSATWGTSPGSHGEAHGISWHHTGSTWRRRCLSLAIIGSCC